MRWVAAVCAATVFTLTGCASIATPETSASGSARASGSVAAGSASTSSPAAPSATASAPKELGTVTASGFGQRDQYVWVAAIVHNNTDLVGQTVTVNFNVLDKAGNLIGSQSQVESFYRPRADHALGTQVDLEPGQKAAKVEATVDVEASGTFSDKPFPSAPTAKMKVGKDRDGATQASFELSNPLTVALKSPRVALVCKNAAGSIIGGTSAYPNLVPASGKVRVAEQVIASGTPATCAVFVGPPPDWDGQGTPSVPTAPGGAGAAGGSATAAPAGTPDGAFKTWMKQFSDKDWAGQYATLVSAQQAVISKDQYVACRSSTSAPKFAWVKLLSVTDAGSTAIPGTKISLPATKVRAQVSVAGMKTPVDAHMYRENGQWKWSMTQENISNCA